MPIVLTLPVRTWASLDAALLFFRFTPLEDPAAQRRAKHCRRLHNQLQRSGVRSLYAPVGQGRLGKNLLRLHVRAIPSLPEPLVLELPLPVARSVARTCLTILEVQAGSALEPLVDHEAEEIRAIQAFLTELRRRNPSERPLVPNHMHRTQLRWDDGRDEYAYADPLAYRLHRHYLRVGAGMN